MCVWGGGGGGLGTLRTVNCFQCDYISFQSASQCYRCSRKIETKKTQKECEDRLQTSGGETSDCIPHPHCQIRALMSLPYILVGQQVVQQRHITLFALQPGLPVLLKLFLFSPPFLWICVSGRVCCWAGAVRVLETPQIVRYHFSQSHTDPFGDHHAQTMHTSKMFTLVIKIYSLKANRNIL